MSRAKWIFWSASALISAGIALFSYRYLLQAGPIPPVILENLFKNPWLAVHVAGAATAPLIGPVQFLPPLRARLRWRPRSIGRIYVAACLSADAAGVGL